MNTIPVQIGHAPYPVYTGHKIISHLAEKLAGKQLTRQIAIITSKHIFRLYEKTLREALPPGADVQVLFVPDGEATKSLEQTEHLYTWLLEEKFERSAAILAFGGGVIGDLAGFVAATYLRGIAFVQIPTTLLAQVDSSIGGKTGINHPLGKNLIGAFKQPEFVLADSQFLSTLPDAEIRCGLGEILKYGFILNEELFLYLEENLDGALRRDAGILDRLIAFSAAEKARVVARDEKEAGLRMVLNFGHTFGHALEAEYKFGELKHGEAVILGMKCALSYAAAGGRLSSGDFERGLNLLNRIPIAYDKSRLDVKRLIGRMTLDKKVKDGQIRLVLCDRPGHFYLDNQAETSRLEEAWQIVLDH